ncbi:hypothetical protein [Solwaraspora sp. WMMD792]|uniref:magnesium transporter MgtE N-terminal domain-containing protein n=1 Tax=Solwaraspora sp. WMMD792 TaxID=3016099 RepID=UPI002416CA2A|nr:hypothetical protein [Solwaraspora sp. WMMD792]MDG4771172.1 hypothetical protein [Solwaraspora sp. WMMD792]
MNASADGQGQVFQAGRDIVISGQPHANVRKLTVLNVAAAAQVLTEMAASAETRDEAVVIVADMDSEVAASRLGAMQPEWAAQILARMDHQLVLQRFTKIPNGAGAAILRCMPVWSAAMLAAELPPERTVQQLARMEPEEVTAILAQMPDSLVAELLIEFPARLEINWSFPVLMALIPFTIAHGAYWLAWLSSAEAARVVAAASAEATVVAFANMSSEALTARSGSLLSKVDEDYLRTVFTLLKPVWRAGTLLNGLTDDRVAAALAGVPETRCAVLLAQVPEERAAEIVRQMPEAKQQVVKPHLW